jgi:hypothetical protein
MTSDSNTEFVVASRFKESNFRRFEPIIISVLERWPQRSIFKPTTISIETFAARLRDAVTAFLQPDCLWDSPIDKEKLKEVWSKKHVKMVGSTVVVCPATGRGHSAVVYETTEAGQQELKELVIDNCSMTHLLSLATLLNDGKLTVPIRLVNSELVEEHLISAQEQFPNIQYTKVPDGFMIL